MYLISHLTSGLAGRREEEREIMQRTPRQLAEVESLESRTHLASVVPSSFSITSSALGNVLNINGTGSDDRIAIRNTSAGLEISNATGWSTIVSSSLAIIRVYGNAGNDRITIDAGVRTNTVLYGGSGVDTLVGGGGNDRLYGGDARDYLYGQAGNDVLVSLGDSSVDRNYGGAGLDSFWTDNGADELIIDASADETAAGALHRISSFMQTRINGATYDTPRTLAGQNLRDPLLGNYATGYANFSQYPLFSKYGPRADDIYQGSLGDCYLLASLGSVANTNPFVIQQTVVDLGDGTYCVQFSSGSTKAYVRVDGDLPTASWGLAYAKLGRQGSLWAAIVEKAYAFFRYNLGTYASIEGGFMGDVYAHMGLSTSSIFNATSATDLLQQLQADLAAGKAVTFGTRADVGDAPITGSHAYMVDAVITDSAGRVTGLRLRNPWGVDDTPGHGANDGYITLTGAQALRAFWFACSARVR